MGSERDLPRGLLSRRLLWMSFLCVVFNCLDLVVVYEDGSVDCTCSCEEEWMMRKELII
jgi:hypothetical protein